MTREKTLRRLEQYMKQGMSKDDALTRLRESLVPAHSGPANSGKLAIMGHILRLRCRLELRDDGPNCLGRILREHSVDFVNRDDTRCLCTCLL